MPSGRIFQNPCAGLRFSYRCERVAFYRPVPGHKAAPDCRRLLQLPSCRAIVSREHYKFARRLSNFHPTCRVGRISKMPRERERERELLFRKEFRGPRLKYRKSLARCVRVYAWLYIYMQESRGFSFCASESRARYRSDLWGYLRSRAPGLVNYFRRDCAQGFSRRSGPVARAGYGLIDAFSEKLRISFFWFRIYLCCDMVAL